ncbi:MAG: hypothetical protein AB1488_04385 [Nitrospirota bacterium]
MKPDLGNFIRDAIKNTPKMSLRNLERLSGVSHSELCKIMNRTRKTPNPEKLKSIAPYIKVDYKYLYYLAGYIDEEDWKWIKRYRRSDLKAGVVSEPEQIYSAEKELSTEEVELLNNFRRIEDMESKRLILQQIKLALKAEGKS